VWARPPALSAKLALIARYFFGASIWIHVVISMHYFASWPFGAPDVDGNATDFGPEATCSVFLCEENTYMTDEQKEAVRTYSSFNILVFTGCFFWVMWTPFNQLLDHLFEWDLSGCLGEEEKAALTDIEFRKVTGQHCYVPQVDRPEMIDPILAINVNNIDGARYPNVIKSLYSRGGLSKADDSKSKKQEKEDDDKKKHDEVYGTDEDNVSHSVASTSEFKGMSKGAAGDAHIKNLFGQVMHYESVGFNTRTVKSGKNTKKSLFGNAVGMLGGVTMGLMTSKPAPTAKPAGDAEKGEAGEWQEMTTPEGKIYYTNHKTKKTSWTKPY
jgi:hypothetical protein